MYPKYHIILGFIFTITLFFLFPQFNIFALSIIFLSSFLIDIDHYLGHAYLKKDLNPFNALKWHFNLSKKEMKMDRKTRNMHYTHLCIFHGIEILVILFFLSYINLIFLYIMIGFSFHMVLDIIYQPFYHDRIDKLSLIYDFFKYKKLKRSN